ncbi:hypothetical protein JMJ77_0011429, partial [Colletotrichum scovillei]
ARASYSWIHLLKSGYITQSSIDSTRSQHGALLAHSKAPY